MRFWRKKSNKFLLNQCFEDLALIRQSGDILAICAKPTGYSWLGVNTATKSLFPKATFEIPQYYSNSIFNENELIILAEEINKLAFKQVIWSGFAPFYEFVCNKLSAELYQKVIYHGFLAEFSENSLQRQVFSTIIRLSTENKISAIGFVKKGFALSVAEKYKIPTFEIILPNTYIKKEGNKVEPGKIKIGCLVNTSFRKNFHNMVFAASMINNVEIHVFNNEELDYFSDIKFVKHDLMEHKEFMILLGSMTLNLHITFSESWGQVLSESLSVGVPCISANTSAFFDYDKELKNKLIVKGFDDSWQIYKKIEEVLIEREYISKRCIEYAVLLNTLAIERLNCFINV